MKTGRLIAPNDRAIVKAVERVDALAHLDPTGFTLDDAGEPIHEYAGETEIVWENTEQIEDSQGNRLYMDSTGQEWTEDLLRFVPEDEDPGDGWYRLTYGPNKGEWADLEVEDAVLLPDGNCVEQHLLYEFMKQREES